MEIESRPLDGSEGEGELIKIHAARRPIAPPFAVRKNPAGGGTGDEESGEDYGGRRLNVQPCPGGDGECTWDDIREAVEGIKDHNGVRKYPESAMKIRVNDNGWVDSSLITRTDVLLPRALPQADGQPGLEGLRLAGAAAGPGGSPRG